MMRIDKILSAGVSTPLDASATFNARILRSLCFWSNSLPF